QVVLSDADLVITAAVETSWPSTLYLNCLWHISKNVPKNCFSSLSESDRSVFMHKFSCSAYEATPEVRDGMWYSSQTPSAGPSKC
ncbi:unnamed protein product, partial [Sphacelaria rigidula]